MSGAGCFLVSNVFWAVASTRRRMGGHADRTTSATRPYPSPTLGAVTLTDGTYRLGPSTGRLVIRTGRAGLGRRAGHDLTIEATRWSGEAVVIVGDPDRSSVSVT